MKSFEFECWVRGKGLLGLTYSYFRTRVKKIVGDYKDSVVFV